MTIQIIKDLFVNLNFMKYQLKVQSFVLRTLFTISQVLCQSSLFIITQQH